MSFPTIKLNSPLIIKDVKVIAIQKTKPFAYPRPGYGDAKRYTCRDKDFNYFQVWEYEMSPGVRHTVEQFYD